MIEKPIKRNTNTIEKAILVAIVTQNQNAQMVDEYLDELDFLAKTLGYESEMRFTQKLINPDIRTFVGKGKLEEIKQAMKALDIQTIIFDDDLSPSQMRNLEKALQCKIYDRSLLILDIFLFRAQTAQAKTQVELARYEYLLPRLTKMWTHLERQRGGTGTRGGAGEKEIETDRRMIRNQITVLKKKLAKIEKQSATRRKSRGSVVRVALVGYTNVGKSTIMKLLSKANVKAEDKLFATVDSTVRKVVIDQIPFLLSDTVGFIRKLPHNLIESFKSTLHEVIEADILLHVVDIAHPAHEDHIQVVEETLSDINAHNKPTILVYNKVDAFVNTPNSDLEGGESPEYKKRSLYKNKNKKTVYLSAIKKENVDDLKNKMMHFVKKRHYTIFPNYLKNDLY